MSFRLHCRDQALPTLIKAMAQTQKKSVVYRAGTEQSPSFNFDDKSDQGNLHQLFLNPVWLEVDRKI